MIYHSNNLKNGKKNNNKKENINYYIIFKKMDSNQNSYKWF